MRFRALVSMRWWLALLFACVAATTAVIVARVFERSAEAGIRERAAELTAGAALTAATEFGELSSRAEVGSVVRDIAVRRRLAVFLFDDDGRRISPYRVLGTTFVSLPNGPELLGSALAGRRAVEPIDDGRRVTVALPLRRGPGVALVAVASRPDLEAALGIVRDKIIRAAAWAIAAGAVLGLVIALLITRRIRRIAAAAATFEAGGPDAPLGIGFPDELGSLALTIDAMRDRLRGSFATLESERDRLHRLLEQLQEGVVAVDRDLRVEFVNTRAVSLLETDLRASAELPEPWGRPSLRRLASGLFEPGAGIETTHVQVDPWHVYRITGVPAADDRASAVIVLADVTERERRERAEREFVANAAHELRTPLTAITSAVEVLNAGAKEIEAERDRFLGIVTRQTARLNALVHALLTLARAQTDAEAVRPEPVVLADLLRDVADDLQVALPVLVSEEGLTVLTHRDLLRQALDNLLSNALRHGEGVDVELRACPLIDGRVAIEVADRGPGMTREEANRAFDRFYRRGDSDGSGYGLGLAIAREVVAVLGGQIEVSSARGHGTTVTVILPSGEGRPA